MRMKMAQEPQLRHWVYSESILLLLRMNKIARLIKEEGIFDQSFIIFDSVPFSI